MTEAPLTRIAIGPMRRRHLRAVVSIEAENQPSPWSIEVFRRELSLGDERTYLVAVVGGRVVGYGGLYFALDEAHVTTMSVDRAHQRQRVGTGLMIGLVRDAIRRGHRALTLEVRAGNRGAQELYRRFGLAPAGMRRDYYAPDREDALVMWAHDIDGAPYADRLRALEAAMAPPGASKLRTAAR